MFLTLSDWYVQSSKVEDNAEQIDLNTDSMKACPQGRVQAEAYSAVFSSSDSSENVRGVFAK